MSKMKRGAIIYLLVLGLTHAAEDNIGAESQDAKTINFRFFDKNKRGATKITNADNPAFNYLSASNAVSGSSSVGGFKPTTTSAQTPFRYFYNQQYYQPNPYLTYVQLPQAAQIAAQYAIQSNPVAHFLQTPNQIQYVAAPTVAQVPQIKLQSYSNDYSSATADSSSSAATGAQHVPQTQTPASISQAYLSSGASASTAAALSQAKQVQVPHYASAQPVYYQQPLLYFPQTQATNFIYQQPNNNYLLKQQQQLASIYDNRFGLYTPTQNQLTYLVPMVVSQAEQDSTTTTSNLKSSDKTASNTQQSVSSNSYTFGAKA